MILYATHTGTRRNLAALADIKARLIVGPDQLDKFKGPPPLEWALDNGAWGCFQKKQLFNEARFLAAFARWGGDADWVVLPDIVAGGLDSLALSLSWIPRLTGQTKAPLLIPAQNGMSTADVKPYLSASVGVFLGGDTEWKLSNMRRWGALAADAGCYYHIGRVNSARRIKMAIDAGANSVDGTSLTRFSVNAPRLAAAAATPRHPSLFPEAS